MDLSETSVHLSATTIHPPERKRNTSVVSREFEDAWEARELQEQVIGKVSFLKQF